MTREEAYNRIDAIIEKHEIDDVYVTITNFKDYDALRMARKLLEQEPILDKIRAEILALSPTPTVYDVVDGNPIKDAVWETIANVLEIIDKYKAESEDKE